MTIITSKKQILPVLDQLVSQDMVRNEAFWNTLKSQIIFKKVKFPILEYIASVLFQNLDKEEQISFLDQIIDLNQVTSYVIAGKMLQLRLKDHWDESFDKAVDYMIRGNEWYTCDVIAERVFGMGLLQDFDATLPKLANYASHENKWIRRAPGIGVHLAVKWKLEKKHIPTLMDLLTKQVQTKDYHVKKGCGWGIETMTKFHPDLMQNYEKILLDKSTNAWVRYKYKLGLNKSIKIKQKRSSA